MKKKLGLLNFGPILIVIAAILWALDGIIRRDLYSLPPITIVFFEHLIGGLVLLPFFLPQLPKIKWTPKMLFLSFLISVGSGILGTLWFTTALQQVHFISFSVVFLLQKLQPIFAIISARIFLGEKISKKYIKWAVLALAAAFFVTFKNGVIDFSAGGAATIVAALYALGAAFLWGSETTTSKLLLKEVPVLQSTGIRFYMTTVLGLITVFLMGQGASLPTISLPQIGQLVIIALSTGMFGVYIYYKGLERTPAQVATLLELVFPMLAVVIDAVMYKTFLAPTQILASVILLFAIVQISRLQREGTKEVVVEEVRE